MFVSNRGRIYGTGGIWRRRTRELHYEETTWKARPDWARDGRRVVYSGYHGRQWNQLWLLRPRAATRFSSRTASSTRPRRAGRPTGVASRTSPTRRATPRSGSSRSPAGGASRIEARTRRYRDPVGRLALTIVDSATGRVLPARVSVTGPDGRTFAPNDAWRHADEAFVRGEQRFEYGYFHSDGRDTLTVPRAESWSRSGVARSTAWCAVSSTCGPVPRPSCGSRFRGSPTFRDAVGGAATSTST